mmetsp:Transcript_200/g.364  ORF Transcript_200/g.364 Transcript_200/m.364 type:complete len:2007 (-) Transcript_200:174-6194(-)
MSHCSPVFDCGQLSALLQKNYTEKRRNIRTTLCEYFSHFIILLLLVFGYNLSDVLYYDAETYTTVSLSMPPSGISSSGELSIDSLYSTLTDVLSGPLPIPSFDTYIQLSQLLSSSLGENSISDLISRADFGQQYGNLLRLGTLHFAPDSAEVDDLIHYLNDTTSTFSTLKYYKHSSENSALRYIENHLEEYTFALIVINSIEDDVINYDIRQNYTTLPNTNQVVHWISIGLDTEYQQYFLSGFLTLQRTVDEWVFDYIDRSNGGEVNSTCSRPNSVSMPFPTAAFDQNIFYKAVGFLLGLAMTMATMYPMSRLVKSVVEEKESRMREVMKIMGLRDSSHQVSWFLTALVLFLWISVTTTLICHVTFLPASDPRLLFVYIFTFCLSEVTFSFLVASFFSKAKLAAIVGPVALFCAILPRFVFYGSNRYEQQQSKYYASLLSPTAFSFGADIIADYEYSGIGVQVYNMHEGLYNFSGCIRLMVADFLIYGLLAWYLDQVIPHDIGTAKHPLFLFQKRYWFPGTRAVEEEELDPVEFSEASVLPTSSVQHLLASERDRVRVIIHKLRKRYQDGKLGVRNLSVCMLEGQITCLLGHNGAGKTTTISVLTGLIEPTAGECIIWNHKLSTDLYSIRKITGICPQHNVLFPSLTVEEHLLFFGRVKGLSGHELQRSADESINDVGLTEKRHVPSSALSGGMKRKLSLAIALVGDPKFVLLDEPTSGMDPYSRRSTWELLQKKKEGRVIVLTTHFMDEADILGDRIAIMSDGHLRCSGTSLFLKTRFGAGYVLTISKKDILEKCDIAIAVLEVIHRSVPDARIVSSIAGEIVVALPITAAPMFGRLFADLNSHRGELCIGSYGVSITTLEQVFIQLAREGRTNVHDDAEEEEEEKGSGPFSRIIATRNAFLRPLTHVSPITRKVIPHTKRGSVGDLKDRTYTFEEVGHNEQGLELCGVSSALDSQKSPPRTSLEVDNASVTRTENFDAQDIRYLAISDADVSNDADKCVVKSPSETDEVKALNTWNEFNELNASHQYLPEDSGIYSWSENQRCEKVYIQLLELMRKRYTIARRDISGLFYQVLLPALQIALVLAILTISINPAGQALKMNASIFPVHPTVVTAGNSSNMGKKLNDHRMLLVQSPTNTSEQVSQYLLNTYSDPKGNRFGGYVFDDLIRLNLTVDWEWVSDNIDVFLNSSGAIESVLEDLGFLEKDENLGDLLNEYGSEIDINLSDLISGGNVDGVSPENAFDAVDGFLDSLFGNASTITVGNNTIEQSAVSGFLESVFGVNLTSVDSFNASEISSLSGFVSVGSIDIANGNVMLRNVYIEINNQTIDIGNVTLTAVQIQNLLPSETVAYTFQVPVKYSVLHNSSSPHGVGAFIGELTTAAYMECSQQSNSQYKSKNHPLPLTAEESLEIQVILSVFASLFILIPLCYIPASFVVFVVKERVSKSKHLQIVSSVSPYLYWAATYTWDMLLYFVLTGFIMLAFVLYGEESSKIFIDNSEAATAVFLLLILYGFASIPLNYIYSFAFDNHSTAQISIMTINFFTGFVAVMAYYIMVSIPSTEEDAEQAVYAFRMFPSYNIGEGLINLSAAYFANNILYRNVSYLSWEVTGRNIVYLICESVGYFGIVILSEAPWPRRVIHWLERKMVDFSEPAPPCAATPDEDVINEANRVSAATHDEFTLLLRNIEKTYPSPILCGNAKHAVRGINLGCAAGERFGLLGINGAGKTTTLGILTGDLQPTSGEAYISGLPLTDPATRNLIGYCPQTDPLLDLMTGAETLWFFGRVRGIEEEILARRCWHIIEQVGLSKHAHRPCGSYSGGNKRKLSLAVALIGNPKVLFLDEPSTGMDPEARRHMWEVISNVSSDRSVVITTHSMEECEAICTRVGIMVSGRMQCMGSCQHLKNRFGTGYQVDVNCTSPFLRIECVQCCGNGPLASAQLLEAHGSYFRLKTDNDLDLAEAFTFLEHLKNREMVLDYSISQSTLEQIFINFAREQEEERGTVAGMGIVE